MKRELGVSEEAFDHADVRGRPHASQSTSVEWQIQRKSREVSSQTSTLAVCLLFVTWVRERETSAVFDRGHHSLR